MTINAVSRSFACAPSSDGVRYTAYPSGNAIAPAANWQMEAGHFVPAKMSMRLVHPAISTTATYIYDNAYPSMAWDVPICVQGGAWPFHYEIVSGPSGMVCGENYGDTGYGRLSWPTPTTGSHAVSIKVTDQQGYYVTRAWTLVVATTKFAFIDAVAGNDSTGDGSIGNPYQTFDAWAGTDKNTAALSGKIAVYRAGTYAATTASALTETGYRWPMGSNKPLGHMAYPGEAVVFDFQEIMWWPYVGTTDEFAVIGCTFQGITEGVPAYVRFDGAARVLFDGCAFNQTSGSANTTSGNNAACIMARDGAQQIDWAITGCTWSGLSGYDFALVYDVAHFLVEGNVVSTYAGANAWGFYFKASSIDYVTVRNNAGITAIDRPLVAVSTTLEGIDNVEICYNNIRASVAGVYLGNQTATNSGRWIYRNTLQATASDAVIQIANTGTTPYTIERNVMEHDGTYTNGIRSAGYSGTATLSENLSDASTDYVTNAGELQAAFIGTYLGVRGAQVA